MITLLNSFGPLMDVENEDGDDGNTQKMTQTVRPRNQIRESTTDRISDLPDELIGDILSHLPIKEAVATIILSRRWRLAYAWITNLDFEGFHFGFGQANQRKRMRLVEFVRGYLSRLKSSSINKFSLPWILDEACNSFVDECVVHVVGLRVKELTLHVFGPWSVNSLHCLFHCETLVVLKLHLRHQGRSLNLPLTTCLPCLKILHVRQATFSSFWNLFSGCPYLTELYLQNCGTLDYGTGNVFAPALKRLTVLNCPEVCKFDAPSLEHFKYLGSSSDEYCMTNLKSIYEARICITDNYSNLDSSLSLQLIESLHHVTILHLAYFNNVEPDENDVVSDDFEFEKPLLLPAFPQLSCLTVKAKKFESTFAKRVLRDLTCHSPRLDELVIENVHRWQPHKTWISFTSLKVIEVNDFGGHEQELAYAEFILRNAEVLNQLILRDNDDAWKIVIEEVSVSLPRGSGDCCVRLIGQLSSVREFFENFR